MTHSSSHTTPPGSHSSDAESAKTAAESLRHDVEQKAREAGQTITAEAQARAEGAKQGVADEISSVSNALRRASDELRAGSPQERTFGSMAGAMADLADTVRGKDLGEMVEDLSDFARRNPLAFLGGAALLGFAGVRMAKASQSARIRDDRYDSLARDTAVAADRPATRTTPASTSSAPAPTVAPAGVGTGMPSRTGGV